MNKISNCLLFFAALLMTAPYGSCKKEDNSPRTPTELLTGTWKFEYRSVDFNGNGVMEPEERDSVNLIIAHTYTFSSDKRFYQAGNYQFNPEPTTWKLTNGDKDISLSRRGTTGDSIVRVHNIRKLTATELVITPAGYRWYMVYQKQ